MADPKSADDRDIVRKGGVAPTDADAEDVTRDSYGFTGSRNISEEQEEQPDHETARRRATEVLGLSDEQE